MRPIDTHRAQARIVHGSTGAAQAMDGREWPPTFGQMGTAG